MKHLKFFEQYLKESIITDIDRLLDSINDKKVDFYSIHVSNDDYINKTIEFLYNDSDFNNQLFKENLKKGEIQNTSDIENFLRKDINMNFFFLYDRNETIIDNPDYLILQYNKKDEVNPIEIYKIKGKVEDFYRELTARTIKLIYDKITYIYTTSNAGNNWTLKDKEKKSEKFKETLETEDIKNLIRDGVKLKIVD